MKKEERWEEALGANRSKNVDDRLSRKLTAGQRKVNEREENLIQDSRLTKNGGAGEASSLFPRTDIAGIKPIDFAPIMGAHGLRLSPSFERRHFVPFRLDTRRNRVFSGFSIDGIIATAF